MSAKDRLVALAGGNIRESIDRERGAAVVVPEPSPSASSRYRGLDRIKGALAIPLDRVVADPDQPRKEFDEEALMSLAASLKERGQLQPARVRFDEASGVWVIVSGERRYRAAMLAGLPSLQAVEAFGELTPDQILEDQLIENCLRSDLKPIEQAHAFKSLKDVRGWSHRQLADHLHIAPSAVSQALALIELPAPVQAQVEQGALKPATAYELSKVADPAELSELAARVVSEGMSRDETAAAVRRVTGKGKPKGRGRKPTSRVIRTATGKVSVEVRKGDGPAAIRAVLVEALGLVDGEREAAA